MLCRVGANLVFALFLCGVGNIRTQISQIARMGAPPFVIPNVVRNLASNAFGVRPSASGGEPTEQRAGRKKIRLSEAKQVT